MTRAIYVVEGMRCQACADSLADAVRRSPGVRSASVTLSPGRLTVDSDPAVDLDTLRRAASDAGGYRLSLPPKEGGGSISLPVVGAASNGAVTSPKGESLFPLFLIVGFILGVAATVTWARGDGSARTLMLDFMAGFFLVFAFFKFLDLRGFADAYAAYDVVASRVRAWGFVYPFLEAGLGVAYLARWRLPVINAAALALMLIGSIGVLGAVLRRERLRCACLGTALNLPMTKVTLIEDLAMAAMAAAALVWPH